MIKAALFMGVIGSFFAMIYYYNLVWLIPFFTLFYLYMGEEIKDERPSGTIYVPDKDDTDTF
jgi:hypothetical protein